MGDLDEALRLALLRDLRRPADDFGDRLVAALALADHVYPLRPARGGHLARVMSRSADAYADWVAMHRRREEHNARLAPARRRGREVFEAAQRRLAGEVPAHAWSPVAASIFGEDPPDWGVW